MSSNRHGPPKHQNLYAWKANAGRKINPTEVGGKLRPYSEITGVCPPCREKIDWKRRYGKYKPLIEPAKCQRCSKRAVRQAYHRLCPACAKEQNVCAKCCRHVTSIVGRDQEEVEAEQKMLEEAIQNSRERDRRSLLRAMNNGSSKSSSKPRRTNVGGPDGNASMQEQKIDEDTGDDDDDDDDNNEEDNHSNDLNDDEYGKATMHEIEKADTEGVSGGHEEDHEDKEDEDDEEEMAMNIATQCTIKRT